MVPRVPNGKKRMLFRFAVLRAWADSMFTLEIIKVIILNYIAISRSVVKSQRQAPQAGRQSGRGEQG